MHYQDLMVLKFQKVYNKVRIICINISNVLLYKDSNRFVFKLKGNIILVMLVTVFEKESFLLFVEFDIT